ncbi:hypothetical protein [Nocardia brevicatena]|uniref:hypothetical protein n=1 Tax=Nocardia brevicatena TaxID=37327 RepID=UPI0003080E35|nr:hypothetical protein [Nocardia brevicatena]
MNDRTTPAVVGADHDLDLLFEQVRRLRELAENPELSSDNDLVYDFGIWWGVMVAGRLPRLAYYSGKGALSAVEQARFDRLRSELRQAQPLIERLSLAKPTAAYR